MIDVERRRADLDSFKRRLAFLQDSRVQFYVGNRPGRRDRKPELIEQTRRIVTNLETVLASYQAAVSTGAV